LIGGLKIGEGQISDPLLGLIPGSGYITFLCRKDNVFWLSILTINGEKWGLSHHSVLKTASPNVYRNHLNQGK
jgi:fatty-acid desaturase